MTLKFYASVAKGLKLELNPDRKGELYLYTLEYFETTTKMTLALYYAFTMNLY